MSEKSEPLNVLVIGTGMYVRGSGINAIGTVLPTLIQAQAQGQVGELHVAGRSPESLKPVKECLSKVNEKLGAAAKLTLYPKDAADPKAYRKALAAIPKPACAIVCVPDHLHAEVTTEVLEAGLHALVVKPLTPTLEEAQRLTELAESKGLFGATDFHKRLDEANLALRQAIESGALGKLRYFTVEFSQLKGIQKAFKSWIEHTNIFQYLGVHYADMIHFLTGALPVRVLATGQPKETAPSELWRLDSVQGLIEWEHPGTHETFASTILTNWIDPDVSSALSDQRIMAVGTEGRFDSDQKHRGSQVVTEAKGTEEPNFYFTQLTRRETGRWTMEGYGPRCIQQFISDVQDLLAGRCTLAELNATRASFRQSLVSTAVVEAVNQSLREGGSWVEIGSLSAQGAGIG